MPTDEWKTSGVRVIPGDQLDGNTAQTPGMDRKAAINYARVGAQKLWAGKLLRLIPFYISVFGPLFSH